MNNPRYHRLSRTHSSEQYQIFDGDVRIGHVDFHYAHANVFATLILERDMSDDDIADLVQQLDDDLVESAETAREDFFVRVFRGTHVDEYSDVLRTEEEIEVEPDSPFALS
jgi:hypothetical protein